TGTYRSPGHGSAKFLSTLSLSLDNNTAPATKPPNAGKIHDIVQSWTLPIAARSKNEMPLTTKQDMPLALVWATRNRLLSTNEPTIASKVPPKRERRNVADSTANFQSLIFS